MGQMPRTHPLDKLISDDSIFLLETLVPFIEYPYKKMLVLFIKYRELMAIMNSLNDRDYISACGFDCHPKSTEEMLTNMCDFIPNNLSSSMKQMKQMMGMMDMMGTINPNSGNDFFSMFNPNQNNSNQTQSHNHNCNNCSDCDSLFASVLSILDEDNKEC